MKVFNLVAIVSLVYTAFMLTVVSFIMFGGERRTESLSEPFTMYKVDMTLAEYDSDMRLGVRYDIQTTGNVQFVCGVSCL